MALILLAGCASPGPPLPPTLDLPAVVSNGLTATRIGDEVRLRWTTPSLTTDKLSVKGPITAVICRETVSAPVRPSQNADHAAETPRCAAVGRVTVTPGVSDARDPLPPLLTAEPVRLLAYRIELLNAAGRTAGPSTAVYAAAGPEVAPVAEFHGAPTKAGVKLEWKAEPGEAETVQLDRVELDRPQAASAASAAKTAATPAKRPARSKEPPLPGSERLALPGLAKDPVETRFQAGTVDAGGTIDRSARIGSRYTYTAERVRSVVAGGQTLEVRSVPSVAVTVGVEDVFPPDAPTGLVSVPGVAGGVGGEPEHPAIDLSWEPNMEPRIVGYRVYRRDLDGITPDMWLQLVAEPVRVTSYRDLKVVAGQRYVYRVTALNEAAHESAPSETVTETAP